MKSSTEGMAPSSSSGGKGRLRSGTGSGRMRSVCSQRNCSCTRLVTSSTRPGHAARRSASGAVAASRCSKLSSTTSCCRSASASIRRSGSSRLPTSRKPSPWASALSTRAGSRTGVRSTSVTPSGKRCVSPARRAAAASARRVFPTPAGPVSVSSRTPSTVNNRWIVFSSSTRSTSAGGAAVGHHGRRAHAASESRADAAWARSGTLVPAVRRDTATKSCARSCASNPSASASSSTVTPRGVRRLPRSSAAMASGLSPMRAASSSCVSPAAARQRRSNAPNAGGCPSESAAPCIMVTPSKKYPHRYYPPVVTCVCDHARACTRHRIPGEYLRAFSHVRGRTHRPHGVGRIKGPRIPSKTIVDIAIMRLCEGMQATQCNSRVSRCFIRVTRDGAGVRPHGYGVCMTGRAARPGAANAEGTGRSFSAYGQFT